MKQSFKISYSPFLLLAAGLSHAQMWGGAKLRMTFENVTINTDYQLMDGEFVAVKNWKRPQITNLNPQKEEPTFGGNQGITIKEVAFTIPDDASFMFDKSTGKIDINVNGQSIGTLELQVPPTTEGDVKNIWASTFPITVKDKDGNEYKVEWPEETTETYTDGQNSNTSNKEIPLIVTKLNSTTSDTIAKQPAKGIYFEIGDYQYASGSYFATQYMNTKQEITAKDVDTAIKQVKWLLNGKTENISELTYSLDASKQKLTADTNLLLLLSGKGDTLASLYITPYYPPIISFSTLPGYNGEFLFDTGYCYPNLLNVADAYKYKSFSVIRNGQTKTYYAPVVGVYKGEERKLKVIYTFFRTEDELKMKNDKNFKLQYRPSILNKIVITDNSPIQSITIDAKDFIDKAKLKSLNIDVIVQPLGEKVGMLEYYCAIPADKEISLFIVKFADQDTYPVDTSSQEALNTFLKTSSLNQLFVNTTIHIKTISHRYTSRQITDTATMRGEGYSTYILGVLNNVNPVMKPNNPFNKKHDYYYITNLTIQVPNQPGKKYGGFHIRGGCGGVQLLGNTRQIEGTTTAHELGHWLGFPDSFNPSDRIPAIADQAKTNNFMDYFNTKKTWVKIQLLNSNRDSN